jgi:hypothetical protein
VTVGSDSTTGSTVELLAWTSADVLGRADGSALGEALVTEIGAEAVAVDVLLPSYSSWKKY